MADARVISRMKWPHILLTSLLGLTGLGQMPIMKRYYVTEVPGLAWLGEFYVVHLVHYVLAALFLVLVAYAVVRWLVDWRGGMRLTTMGAVRAVLLLVVVVSGVARVVKNEPGITWGMYPVLAIDWIHLMFSAFFGLAALAAVLSGRRAYLGAR